MLRATLTAVVFASIAFSQNLLPKRNLITQPVDNKKRFICHGNTHPSVNTYTDRGRISEAVVMDHMLLQLRRPAELEQALDQYLSDLHKPGSANFHHWLNAEQFGERFGLSQHDLNIIVYWLQSQGFNVTKVYPNKMLIDFSGNAGQVNQAFSTQMHHFQINGRAHVANISDPQIPEALSPAVAGVTSLTDFKPHRMVKPRPRYTFTSGATTVEALVPADLATIYNLNPLFAAQITGAGQTIVVIEDTDVFSTADWDTFRTQFGLAGYTSGSFKQVHPGGCSDPGVTSGGADGEAILDAEWATAAAPNAAIQLASCADTSTTFGGLIALENLLNASATPPPIVSISYGECEAQNGAAANLTYLTTFQQAVAEGVSVFVSAGDEGAASCDANANFATHGIGVSGFASTPYNVAVGGTDFSDTFSKTVSTYWRTSNTPTFSSALSYIPEIPWNSSCGSALLATFNGFTYSNGSGGFCNSNSGQSDYLNVGAGSGGPSGCATGAPSSDGIVGGTCQGYAKPAWQSGVFGNPNDNVRDIPDVSLFAANGAWGHFYVFCWSDTASGGADCSGAPSTWSGAGGTSFSAPILAGIQALVNQKNGGRQGNPNPVYYALAAAEYGAAGTNTCLSNKVTVSSCVFYDVTQGDIDVPCNGATSCYDSTSAAIGQQSTILYGVLSTSTTTLAPAFKTGNGWDFATGLGTVNAYNLVQNWSTVTPR